MGESARLQLRPLNRRECFGVFNTLTERRLNSMKHIATTLAAIALASFSGFAVAAPFDRGDSILISQVVDDLATPPAPAAAEIKPPGAAIPEVAATAPSLDPTAAPAQVAPPIPAGTLDAAEAPVVHQPEPHRAPVYYHRQQKKQSVFDKLMEMERKKNAWFKRTFLGR